ncbi:hypothetical protein [Chromobacterium haemolyticum]|uniref:hypothetical protein n=1 Tax=Chromobacterium haemolyticum TaxID=394935 RepID=UPI0017477110|nr:hypothetical protein [Chromobacterium haemolyticum]QOD81413.1 hypothetical protein IEZ30_15990 [Chromobacterium haemolyticum]
MLKLALRLVSWGRRLLSPAKVQAPAVQPRPIPSAAPVCLSWPMPGRKSGVAAIRRAAKKARKHKQRRTRHV